TAVNTSFSMEWSDIGKVNESGNEILYTLQSNFSSPFIALLLQIGLFLLTVFTVQLIMCVLYAIYKKQSILHVLNILLFIFGIAGFKIIPASLPFLEIPNYLLLFHGAERFSNIVMPFVIVVLVLTITILIANNVDKNKSNIKTFLNKNYPITIYILLCLMGVWFNIERYVVEDVTIWNILTIAFIGTTDEMYSL